MASAIQIMRRRRERREKRHRRTVRRAVSAVVIILAVVFLGILPTTIAVGGAAVLYAQGARGLPAPMDTISIDPMIGPTRLYDRNGETLLFSVQDPLGDERTWISLDAIPPFVAQATLITEDPDFMMTTHFDALQTASKLWRNLILGPLPPDSSLTGRLVRNAITAQPNTLNDYVTVDERGAEIALVAEINRLYSPLDVLEWHLNTNYYGNEAYGI
ncbi:MAG: transglycosylase domain-containing protein, partial [Burkholderiales bacterium]|nr:transglycosylase domain-containing protein [Anaerolineae bacterium]